MTELIPWRDILEEHLRSDPAFRAEWERTALARAVAIALVKYRADHDLTQRELATRLGMPYSQIARLELGEYNPSVKTLQRLAAGLDQRFILAVVPPGKDTPLPLAEGITVLADVTLADGTRLLAAAG